jgi:murein DD-endopeptidase MepM/ murein hydrolase activator NlpD/O-acetyl-ADP-ribose deacetylase (regulator of RNase III)
MAVETTKPHKRRRAPASLLALLSALLLLFMAAPLAGVAMAAPAGETAVAESVDSGDTAAALSADLLWARALGGVTAEDATVPVVGILFPMEERVTWVDTFGAPRDGGTRTHAGNDLLAPKMTPLLAVVDGEVDWLDLDPGSTSCNLLLRGDDGNDYFYIHMNNDTPGTDDGLGCPTYTYAPKLVEGGDGTRVECGELIGWVGDSGNAEYTVPHLHFEIHYGGYKNPIDPYESLMAAPTLAEWIAAGRPDLSNPEPTIPCPGLRGTDRYHTALLISQAMFTGALPDGAGLVLAPGETFQEALCGTPLAAAYGGPVLLTPSTGLNNAVRAEIVRLAPDFVVCIGLSDSIVAAVQTVLGTEGLATAIRGTGGNAYDMSYRVALALRDKVGDLSEATAIVTIGTKFPDAIGVSPLACAKLWPIILTDATSGALCTSAAAALDELGIAQVLKVGTYVAMPEGVTGVANLSGADRYYTNRNVAEWAKNNAGLTFAHTGLATGDKFPDALAAGPYLARDGGILLLTPLNGPLPACVRDEIAANSASMTRFSFIAMIEPVLSQVKRMLP